MNRLKVFIMGFVLLSITSARAFAFHPGEHRGKHKPPHEIMDVNKDGKVSQDEWDSFHSLLFDEIDKNGDGVLEENEFRSHHDEMRKKLEK